MSNLLSLIGNDCQQVVGLSVISLCIQYKELMLVSTLLETSVTMFGYVVRSVCVLVILVTVIHSQEDLELDQYEILDEELEGALLDEGDTLLDEEIILLDEEGSLLEEDGVLLDEGALLEEDSALLEEDGALLEEKDSLTDEDAFPDEEIEDIEDKVERDPDSESPSLILGLIEKLSSSFQKFLSRMNASGTDIKKADGDDSSVQQAFITSFFVTLMSELGDKTFFMSAILAMNHSRMMTFIGTTIGQTIMTLVAVCFGMAASFIPQVYTQWASAIIMTVFGIKMLKDSAEMDGGDGLKTIPEKEEIKSGSEQTNGEVVNGKVGNGLSKETVDGSLDTGKNGIVEVKPKVAEKSADYTKGVMIQALTLCLMGEWGDKSQIATILLATNEDPYMVAGGGIIAHILCNAIAVFGGRMLASKFPAKFVTQMGGVFFLLAAASSFVFS